MDSETGKKHKGEGDHLEVTGVSRSGRVRKKSSKLMDFESPDDLEVGRPKRPAGPPPVSRAPPPPSPQPRPGSQGPVVKEEPHSGSESDYFDPTLDNPNDSMDSLDSDEVPSDEDAPLPRDTPRPSHSLYMMEQSNKRKLLIKDGKVVGRAKAQRKDKGKSRVTAYMLWAKGVRNDLLKQHPDMDFSAVSKRLGEMWANVTYLERYVWKRKAKRLAAKQAGQNTPSKSINVPSAKQDRAPNHIGNQSTPAILHTPIAKSRHHSKPAPHSNNSTGGSGGGPNPSGGGGGGGGVYRVVGVGPADIGAHLRLLGESLTIIGERLKEHEGQIAVSGSVSVLLDTLLCSLAPLVCLTAHIPAIAPPIPLLQDTLHNIAYIMPGL